MDAQELLNYINDYLSSLGTADAPYGYHIVEDDRVVADISEFEITLIRDDDNAIIAKQTTRLGRVELTDTIPTAIMKKEKENQRERFIKDLLLRGAIKTGELFDDLPRKLKDGELVVAED